MTESIHDYQGRLFTRIVGSLENGGRLTEATLAYIETALFPPAADRLIAFLTDESDCERDSLLDLIFSPDQSLQVDLEPLLASAGFSCEDEAAVYDRLMARSICAPVTLPDGRPLAGVRVPDLVKSQYLARLNITWQPDPRVASAIESGVSAQLRPTVMVRLRNAGLRLPSGARVFMCRFFERMADSDPDYLDGLDLVLAILETAGQEADAYDLLADRKRCLFRGLQQIRRFETLLRQSNMETLMLHGIRAPHASPGELMHHMRLIDLICFSIFGKTETIEPPMEEPLRQVPDLDTPEAAIRSLMR
jgi:hypothetical protein